MTKTFVLSQREAVEAILAFVVLRERQTLEGSMSIVVNRKGRDGIGSIVLEVDTEDDEIKASL